VSVAVLPAPAVVYREEQNFAWWIYALLAVMVFGGVFGMTWEPDRLFGLGLGRKALVPMSALLGLALPALMFVTVLRMTTLVLPTECHVWFGWVPSFRYAVPLSQIKSIEVVTYRPLRDTLGWGVRRGRDGEKALTARGNRGVRLDLLDGTTLLIGSQTPEELARMLDRGRRDAA
jgi:hypothetical protein